MMTVNEINEGLIHDLERSVDEWEIYQTASEFISAGIEGGNLKSVNSGENGGFAVRVILKGRTGFASCTSPKKLEDTIRAAIKLAKVSEDEMNSFPDKSFKEKTVEGIYDRKVEKIDPEYIREEVETVLSSVDSGNIAIASIEHEVTEVRITNSSGIEFVEKSTSSTFIVEVVHAGAGSGYEMEASRTAEINVERAVKKAEALAIESARAQKIEGGLYDVLLEPIAVHQLFFYTLYPSFSAENVVKGRSRVKLGDKYGSLTLIDDPTIRGGLMSCSFDDEGVVGRKTTLMDGGVVKSYYTDWKHSFKMNMEPTSNGFRSDISMPPAPAPSNVVVDLPNKENFEDEKGLLKIHSFIGAHTSNPISGDFSLECMNASIDGRAVKGAMVYGNIFELLGKLDGTAGDVRQIENTVTPSLHFVGVRII
jgi:PmbA protein